MMHRSLPLALLVALCACAHRAPAVAGAEPAAAEVNWDEKAEVVIEVQNHHWSDVTVYVEGRDGFRRRVGVATAATTSNFTIRGRLLGPTGEFRLLGDPIGQRRTIRSDALRIFPGQTVSWTLETNLERSMVAVY